MYGEFIYPNSLGDIEYTDIRREEVRKLQNAYTRFIQETVLTEERLLLLKCVVKIILQSLVRFQILPEKFINGLSGDFGPKQFQVIVGDYDHARDSNIIISKRIHAFLKL